MHGVMNRQQRRAAAKSSKVVVAGQLCNRGSKLSERGFFEKAIDCYKKALTLQPDFAAAFYNCGNTLLKMERLEEAIENYDKALTLKPDDAEFFHNRGIAYANLDRFAEAFENFERALSLAPPRPEVLRHRGVALEELQRYDEALTDYAAAQALAPDCEAAQGNDAALRLRRVDFDAGWKAYECRLQTSEFVRYSKHAPLWRGEKPIFGKTILLHAEQGFGDTVQFIRYALLLVRRGAKVICEVQPELQALLSQLENITVIPRGEPLPEFDFHCPLLSLPLAFGTKLGTIPATIPYLRAPRGGRHWDAMLPSHDRPRVGIVWSGNPEHLRDRSRSISLDLLSPLFDVDATFVSLQKDARKTDASALARLPIIDITKSLENYADTAALISNLDLVISVDTSVAHLAGALGKPVWILLPFTSEWRWLLDREDSPWYPTARLFRQSANRQWQDVIERVRVALEGVVTQSLGGAGA